MKLTFSWLFPLVGFLLILETESSIDVSIPVSPEDYQKVAGPGFAVKFFSTDEPLSKKYRPQNIDDIFAKKFTNVRLRCGAKYYPYPYTSENFTVFLNKLEEVVDKCLDVGVAPIISWAYDVAENRASDYDKKMYLKWWKLVARKLKKKNYRLSFNLVTELSNEMCRGKHPELDCIGGSLKTNNTKYTEWMTEVIKTIRGTGGNNDKRILILGPPRLDAEGLCMINKSIYENETYMMAEYHTYAAGPTNKTTTGRFWEGCGNATQRQHLINVLERAKECTTLKTYWGAWMVQDNMNGGINQTEAECFAEYFTTTLKNYGTPWSLNALEIYYNTANTTWLTGDQVKGKTGAKATLNFYKILEVIQANMI